MKEKSIGKGKNMIIENEKKVNRKVVKLTQIDELITKLNGTRENEHFHNKYRKELKNHLKSIITNNIQTITINSKRYIVFDALYLNSKYQSKYTSLSQIQKEALKNKDFASYLATTFLKDYTTTHIYYREYYDIPIDEQNDEQREGEQENILEAEIETHYKEFKRTKYEIEFNDATHFLTITYKSIDTDDIFKKIEYNNELTKKATKGFKRMRNYIEKLYKDTKKKREIEDMIKYIRVIELTKKGTVHIHTLIKFPKLFRRNFKKMIKLLADWFETAKNGIDLKYLKYSERKKASEYISKYINKYNNDTHTIRTIDDTKIYVADELKLMYNGLKRKVAYSLKSRPIIKKIKPSKIKSFKKKEVNIEKELIKREKYIITTFNSNFQKIDEDIKETILKEFIKLEWKRFDAVSIDDPPPDDIIDF